MNINELKEKCIFLYVKKNKTFSDIAKEVGYSRTYITNMIKEDPRIIAKRNEKIIKVYKRANTNQMRIEIPTEFIEKLGISHNKNIAEYVKILFNESAKKIIIEKHS